MSPFYLNPVLEESNQAKGQRSRWRYSAYQFGMPHAGIAALRRAVGRQSFADKPSRGGVRRPISVLAGSAYK